MTEEIDWDRIDDTALVLLSLTLHDGDRVWKELDWDITDRLREKGWISDPRSKAKSVLLSPDGRNRAQRLFEELFARGDGTKDGGDA